MPNFELKFTATPQLDPQADAKLKKQWDNLQKSIKNNLEMRPEVKIPQGTFTRLRHRYVQMMNELGKNPVEVKLDLKKLEAQLGESKFKKLGLGEQYAIDLANHRREVRNLESEYVNLKVKMRDAAETLTGDMKTERIAELEQQVGKLGEKIKATFASDEIEHFNRTMGELGGKGSAQVVGIQEFANSISGVRERIVELSGEGERLVRITQVFEDGEWRDSTTQIQDRTAKLTQEFKRLTMQVDAFEKRYGLEKGSGAYAQRWEDLKNQIAGFNVEAPNARQAFEEISQAFASIKGDVGGASDKLSLYKRQLNEIIQAEINYRKVLLDKRNVQDDETKALQENIKSLRDEAAETRKSIDLTDKSVQADNAEIDAKRRLANGIDAVNKKWAKQNSILANIGEGFKEATARIVNYTVVYRLLWVAVAKLRQSIDVAEELNQVFADIEMVTMGTAEATQKLRKEYADLAVEMSATVTDVGLGANEWLNNIGHLKSL